MLTWRVEMKLYKVIHLAFDRELSTGRHLDRRSKVLKVCHSGGWNIYFDRAFACISDGLGVDGNGGLGRIVATLPVGSGIEAGPVKRATFTGIIEGRYRDVSSAAGGIGL